MHTEPNRRNFLKAAVAAPLLAQASAKPKLQPFNYSGVRLGPGMLRDQFLYARDLFLKIPNDSFLIGFRKRAGIPAPGTPLTGWYDGDPRRPGLFGAGDTYNAFGQYLSGMARMGKASGHAPTLDKASELMEEWAKAIDPDGYFYYSRHPHTPHYIYEKTCCGLVDLYEYGGQKRAMEHLERITDWAIKNLDRSRKNPILETDRGAGGQEWYTLSENLYRAYVLTGDERYKTFGDLWRYPAYWEMFQDKHEVNRWKFHAYSHVNTFSSAAMTYAVTADPRYLETITHAFDWLEKTQLYATGGFGPGENIVPPDGSLGSELETNPQTFETICGSWACFKLSRYLMMFTGEAKYGDWIEKLVYNGVGASLPLLPDGYNFYYSDYQMGGGRKLYHGDWKWSCCSGTYPQSIADYHNLIYFQSSDGLYVNLYIPSEVEWSHGKLTQETSYPESDATNLTIQGSGDFALRFRVPRWCEGASVTVNGAAQRIARKPGTWAEIRRAWKSGDRVAARFPMAVRMVPVDTQHPRRVALAYGPVVLTRQHKPVLEIGKRLHEALRSGGAPLEFRAGGSDVFVPFYRLKHRDTYDTYFDIAG
jgi:DUF1680 family protein